MGALPIATLTISRPGVATRKSAAGSSISPGRAPVKMPFRLATAALQADRAAMRTTSLATVSPTSTHSLQHRRQGRSSGGAGRTVCSLKGQQLAFDPMLVGGDAFVLLSMQMASDSLPLQNTGLVSMVLLATWLAVAAAKRDYSLDSVSYDAWSVREPVVAAMKSAALTWAFFAPLMATVYCTLINQNLLVMGAGASEAVTVLSHPAGVWASVPQPDITTPEGEVLVAALFCLTAWRAFYSAFRAWSNLM